MTEIQINSLEGLREAAESFLKQTAETKIYAFYAPMGTGKTTFIKAIAEAMGVSEVVNSPTFALVNSYSLPLREGKLYHIDCYRLNNRQEALAIGMEEYLSSGEQCFIEWPEVIEEFLPSDHLKVYIEANSDGSRTIRF